MLVVLCLVVSPPLLLPILLPLVTVLIAIDNRRKARAAEAFACVLCGKILGRAGLARGDAAWAEHFSAIGRARPYSKLRVVRDMHAICPRCNQRYRYDLQARTFRPLPGPPL